MASNSFGRLFRCTTWGESHGKAVGVVIDGCPAGLEISEGEIQQELALRAPGKSPYTSPRKEEDKVQILSGLFEGRTTGAPISLLIENRDADSDKYHAVKELYKPGHANFTYLQKYGLFDYRGGGRASARETLCRVAAGAIAKKALRNMGIEVVAWLRSVGEITAEKMPRTKLDLQDAALFCPDQEAAVKMAELIRTVREQGDSVGGVVECLLLNLPAGLGDPVYEKLEATLAHAMMGIPASKGFEIGEGFGAARLLGSQHNDGFSAAQGSVRPSGNRAGGTLGGISTGMPVRFRVAFKPTSSIMLEQKSATLEGEEALFKLPEGSRHDPCVAIRAVPVVEAMAALVAFDALLYNRTARLDENVRDHHSPSSTYLSSTDRQRGA